jgi:hypothetical protein
MDGNQIVGVLVIAVAFLVAIIGYFYNPKPLVKTVGSFDLLNRLPFAFYLLGIIGGFILFGFTVATAAESSTAETGAMFGYTIGASLSIIAIGRIIEVLQQIRDK